MSHNLDCSARPPFLWSACRVHLMCLCPWPWGSRRYYSRNLCYDISVVSPPNSIHAFIVLVYNFWIFNSPKTLNVIGFSNSVYGSKLDSIVKGLVFLDINNLYIYIFILLYTQIGIKNKKGDFINPLIWKEM